MRSRAGRFLVLVILLASGAGAAWSSWNASRLVFQLDRDQRDLSNRVDRLLAVLDTVTSAQQAYVTPSPELDVARVPDLIGQLRSETEQLRSQVRSVEAGRELQGVSAAVVTLQDVDERAQEHIRVGQSLMASDLIFSDGRAADETIASGLRTIRTSESDAYATARANALDVAWTVSAGVAALWVLGLVLLVRVPHAVTREEVPVTVPTPSLIAMPEPTFEAGEPQLSAPLDLQRAADVCTAIGRLSSGDELPLLLQRAASVLDASGMVVWMAAGEELFAAAAFGYPPQVIRRLGPIHRSAINATAAAWRSGTLQAVAGDHGARGALAAPMLGPDRCIGVLAVEVGVGQDGNAATRAVTMLFAAQLAAALAAWPAASAAAPVEAPPLDTAVEG
jgi:hypothetical protein